MSRNTSVPEIFDVAHNYFCTITPIGQGKHQKAWKQEIRREHNSNPLQRNSYVHFREIKLAVFQAIWFSK